MDSSCSVEDVSDMGGSGEFVDKNQFIETVLATQPDLTSQDSPSCG